MAFELLDVIGPRLVGSPAMKQANDWAVEKYKGWGIDAQNQQFGEWASWQRGITQVEMTSPRVKVWNLCSWHGLLLLKSNRC